MDNDFRDPERRQLTFRGNWSHGQPSIQNMAGAGFIFTGQFPYLYIYTLTSVTFDNNVIIVRKVCLACKNDQ